MVAGLALGYGLACADGRRAVATGVRVGEHSFSEAAALKEGLVELAWRHVHALRGPESGLEEVVDVHRLRTDPRSLARIEGLIEEYANTPQESELTHVRMVMLWRSDQKDRWLDEYLRIVYQHPTWATVTVDSMRARELACALGRMGEWERARAHLRSIPEVILADRLHPKEIRCVDTRP